MLRHKREWIAALFACGLIGFSISQNLAAKPEGNPADEFGFPPNAAFFKLDIALKYRGKPIRLAPVVGCSVAVERVPGGGTAKWKGFGMNPNLYMVQMEDGGAVAVVPPAFCKGETTSSGTVPQDFLPTMMIFDRTDQIDFATAYLNSDAYEAPGAAMTEIKATVEKASAEDFLEFRRSGPPNMISKEDFQQPYDMRPYWGVQYVGRGRQPMSCAAYGRFEMPENMRESARKIWPDSKPKYWSITKYGDDIEIVGKNNKDLIVKDTYGNPKKYSLLFNSQTNPNGLPTRSGHHRYVPGAGTPAEIYPVYRSYQWQEFNRLPVAEQQEILNGTDPLLGMVVDMRPERRGMAYCQTGASLDSTIVPEGSPSKRLTSRRTKRFVGNELMWSPPGLTLGGSSRYFFEEDSHFWENISMHIRYPNGSN